MKCCFLIVCFALGFLTSNGQSKKDSLYVFVGEKIEITKLPGLDRGILYYSAIKAKYRIIQLLHGCYNSDTIEFEAYDHYSRFEFSKYKYVLLYVSVEEGKLVHERYQFTDVYPTKSGNWAGSTLNANYGHPYNKDIDIKPEPIDFIESPVYDLKYFSLDDIPKIFPSPFYDIKDNKAIARWGNYVEELFQLRKMGVLKARGIFD